MGAYSWVGTRHSSGVGFSWLGGPSLLGAAAIVLVWAAEDGGIHLASVGGDHPRRSWAPDARCITPLPDALLMHLIPLTE